jgi:hypothetical protein
MAVLNLRDVPEEIMRSLKVDAAASGKTLRELCLERLVPDGGKSWLPVTIARPENHDVASCRIYKCGMCAVIKAEGK